MRPILVNFAGRPLYSYWFFFGMAMLVGMLAVFWVSHKRRLSFWKMWGICVCVIPAAFLMTRFSHIAFGSSLKDFHDFGKGGEVSFGGIAGAFIGAFVMGRLLRLPTADVLDAAGPSVFLAQGIQRVGCLLNGCCHGPVSHSMFAYACPKILNGEGDIVGTPCFLFHLQEGLVRPASLYSLPVFPIQLVSLLACFFVAGAGIYMAHRRLLHGKVVWFCFVAYGLARFVIQWFRPNYDSDGALASWNSGHILSLIMVVIGLGGMFTGGLRKREQVPGPRPRKGASVRRG